MRKATKLQQKSANVAFDVAHHRFAFGANIRDNNANRLQIVHVLSKKHSPFDSGCYELMKLKDAGRLITAAKLLPFLASLCNVFVVRL